MNSTLSIKDEMTFSFNAESFEFQISLNAEVITVRDLIRERIRHEVEEYNEQHPDYFRGLVQPSEAERTLNGFRLPKKHFINWETQYEKAVEAFARNGFLLLVNDRQVEDLDEIIEVTPQTSITFLKLVPLVGG